MKRFKLFVSAVTLTSVTVLPVSGCGLFDDDLRDAPLRPMPSGVPESPRYRDVDDVLRKLHKQGLSCEILRRSGNDSGIEEELTCDIDVDAALVQLEIHVYNLNKLTREEIGDVIAGRLAAPFNQTIVASGNWYVRVLNPLYVNSVALALDGVALSGEDDPPSVSTPTPTATE